MIEANHVVPYTKQEVIAIIAACDQMGRTSYERRRARAMTLLMRYAGLRISDVVTLSRDHIRGTRLEKRAIKNHLAQRRGRVPRSAPAPERRCRRQSTILFEGHRQLAQPGEGRLAEHVSGL
jgi:integrase